jgi:hypothetical protein
LIRPAPRQDLTFKAGGIDAIAKLNGMSGDLLGGLLGACHDQKVADGGGLFDDAEPRELVSRF